MGITKSIASILIKEGNKRPYQGRLLTLGKQKILFDYYDLFELFKLFKFSPNNNSENYLDEINNITHIDDKQFFKSLGFSSIESLDISDYEGADILFDLNNPNLPFQYINKYDVIVDSGTIEHIFNIPEALKNISEMLKIEGRIFHFTPCNNCLDHGFYQISPTFFYDFYNYNKFKINQLYIYRYFPRNTNGYWDFYEYNNKFFRKLSIGGLDNAVYGISCIVTKEINSTNGLNPQQSTYESLWVQNIKISQNDIFKDTYYYQLVLSAYIKMLVFFPFCGKIFEKIRKLKKRHESRFKNLKKVNIIGIIF